MDETLLFRIDSARNMRRFYVVRVEPNLFGEMTVLRSWGRIGTRGQVLRETYASVAEAEQAALRQIGKKAKRGYSAKADADRDCGTLVEIET